jgi:hypothetical protein
MRLQATINKIDDWAKKCRIKLNQNKSTQITFTLRNQTRPIVQMTNVAVPKKGEVKCLGMHLDRSLTWAKHNKTKRNQLNLKAKQMHRLLRRSALSIESKLLQYRAVLRPIWSYGLQLWGTASSSNIEILQRFQSKSVRCIVSAPWYITTEST